MVSFFCPSCRYLLEADDSQAGQQIACTQCGAFWQVPAPYATPPPPVGAAEVPIPPSPSTAPSQPAPFPQQSESFMSAPSSATPPVVYLHYRDRSHRIHSDRTLADTRKILHKILYDFGLDVEEGEVFGEISHSYTSFMTIKVRGEISYESPRNELHVDLSSSNNFSALGILLGILCWPLLIVGAILLPNHAKEEFSQTMWDLKRALERKFRA